MNRVFLAAFLELLSLLPGGCKSNVGNQDAIRDGIVKYIAGRKDLNVNNMTITVSKVTITGDKAQANVEIRAKNSDPGTPAMQVDYELQKQGDQWAVSKSQPAGGIEHPLTGSMPASGTLPPGHPATGGQMPASHPDFNSILNSAQPQSRTQQQPSGSQQSSTNTNP